MLQTVYCKYPSQFRDPHPGSTLVNHTYSDRDASRNLLFIASGYIVRLDGRESALSERMQTAVRIFRQEISYRENVLTCWSCWNYVNPQSTFDCTWSEL